MSKTWELMREGVTSRDGRSVAADACTWPDGPIPVLGFSEFAKSADEGGTEIHGTVENIRREGNLILGDCSIEIPPGACLTVGGMVGDEVVVADDGTWVALKFEIKYATVSGQEEYPWD